MTDQAGIQIQLSSIEKGWKASGNDEFWILLRTKRGSLEEFAAAVFEANEDAAARGEDGDAYAEAPSPAPHGFGVLMAQASNRGALQRWVVGFARRLQVRGLSGKLAAAPPWRPPSWLRTGQREPTAFLAWTVDIPGMSTDADRDAHWHVDWDTTVSIASFADHWARTPGAELVLSQNTHAAPVWLDDTTVPVARSVSRTGMAGLLFLVDADELAMHVSLSFGGGGVFQIIGGRDSWQTRVARLRETLVALPGATNQGFIRPAHRQVLGISAVDVALPLPGI